MKDLNLEQCPNLKKCPLCKVNIDFNNNTVYFSQGKPGTTERLHVRVCAYAKDRGKTGCINPGYEESKIQENDYYKPI